MNLRLLGTPTVKGITPEMVDASNIHSHITAVPSDSLYDNNCVYSECFLDLLISLLMPSWRLSR